MVYKRTPKNYDGSNTTSKLIGEILPALLQKIEKSQSKQPNKVLKAWSEIIGEKLAPMTKAVSLENGVLYVKVQSSTLLNVLCQYEKERLIQKLQEKFSKDIIRDIKFKIG